MCRATWFPIHVLCLQYIPIFCVSFISLSDWHWPFGGTGGVWTYCNTLIIETERRFPASGDWLKPLASVLAAHQVCLSSSSVFVFYRACVCAFRRLQLRSLMSWRTCQHSPCPAWRYPNTSRWWSCWERDPMEKSCWLCTEREVSAQPQRLQTSLIQKWPWQRGNGLNGWNRWNAAAPLLHTCVSSGFLLIKKPCFV